MKNFFKKAIVSTIIVLSLSQSNLLAQDVHFSQFYGNKRTSKSRINRNLQWRLSVRAYVLQPMEQY